MLEEHRCKAPTVLPQIFSILLLVVPSANAGDSCQSRVESYGPTFLPHHAHNRLRAMKGTCVVDVKFELMPDGTATPLSTTTPKEECGAFYREAHRAILAGQYKPGPRALSCEQTFQFSWEEDSLDTLAKGDAKTG